jgi:hypothetical protein
MGPRVWPRGHRLAMSVPMRGHATIQTRPDYGFPGCELVLVSATSKSVSPDELEKPATRLIHWRSCGTCMEVAGSSRAREATADWSESLL